ncbi:MAG: DUF1674 domain-containing protein [Candidatus Pelagibacterales bacterium]|jgi:hypothetical protein|tara:strand:- start:1162 stop:1320 length:159 start_codon:yes stop_codon:yes gene_type:complete
MTTKDLNKDSKDNKVEKKIVKKDSLIKEIGGQVGPEPTRFGDWEKKGITSDF